MIFNHFWLWKTYSTSPACCNTVSVQMLCMLRRPHHPLSSTAPLRGVTRLFKEKTPTHRTALCGGRATNPPAGCSHAAGSRTCAVRGAAAPAAPCEPELLCEPELVHFLPLWCFVLLHCWPARPPPSPRQRMRPEFSVFLFSESPPYFLLFGLRTNFGAFSMFCLIFPAADSAAPFLCQAAAALSSLGYLASVPFAAATT